jgi:hypothetical protein
MVCRTPSYGIMSPLHMAYQTPYTRYIEPPNHGILTPYRYYLKLPTHGVSNPILWYYETPILVEMRVLNLPFTIYNDENLILG